jgi:pyruvate/2-oxoglutarate dehydrogenase complex dihydrolipoamide acyltransferase (E2) component
MDIVLPQLGESILEGTVSRWFKNVGDTVTADEPLFEVSTDKVDTEVPSPTSGVLTEILVQAGETVSVGTVLARLSASVASSTASQQSEPAAPIEAPSPAVSAPQPVATAPEQKSPVLSPVVRRLAETNDIDAASLSGSGPGGRVTRQDVETVIAQHNVQEAAPTQPQVAPATAARPAVSTAAQVVQPVAARSQAVLLEGSSLAASEIAVASLSKVTQQHSALAVFSYATLRAVEKLHMADPSFAVEVAHDSKPARLRIENAGDLRLAALSQRVKDAVGAVENRNIAPGQLLPAGVVVRHAQSAQLSYSPDSSSVVVTLGATHRAVGVVGDGIGITDTAWLTVTAPTGNIDAAQLLGEILNELCRDWSSES